jgi:hypothetical protein
MLLGVPRNRLQGRKNIVILSAAKYPGRISPSRKVLRFTQDDGYAVNDCAADYSSYFALVHAAVCHFTLLRVTSR